MRVLALSSALLLAGCNQTWLAGVSPDVDYEVVVASVVKDCDAPPGAHTDPTTAMEVGFTKVQAACQAFFDEATRAQQNAVAANKGLDLLLVAATAVINPTVSAAAAAKAITITTAGVTLTKAIIDDVNSVYSFNNYLYKVQDHVTTSMEDYMARARGKPPANYCLAYTYVQKLAMLCSLSTLKSTLDQQVALPAVNTPNKPDAGGGQQTGQTRMMRRSSIAPRRSVPETGADSGPPSISYSVRPAW